MPGIVADRQAGTPSRGGQLCGCFVLLTHSAVTATSRLSTMSLHSESVGISVAAPGGGGAATPVPLSAEPCGLPAALDATLTAPLRTPSAVGVNVTLMMHVAVGASVAPQVFVCAKSPDAAMLAMLSVVPPMFCSVSACAAVVAPMSWLPNASAGGVRDTAGPGGAAVPVPLSVELCGLPATLEATLTAPLRTPSAVGVKVTLIVHEAEGASVAAQVFVCAKSPDAAMLAMLSVAVPMFWSVSGCAAEVVPTCWLPKASAGEVRDTAGAGGSALGNSIPRRSAAGVIAPISVSAPVVRSTV